MSRPRDKGTRGENEVRDFVRPVFPRVARTGSDHSTEWGAADLRETGAWAIEVKKHKDVYAAVRTGWSQAERNAAWADKRPMLVALRHGLPVSRGLVVVTLADMMGALDALRDREAC